MVAGTLYFTAKEEREQDEAGIVYVYESSTYVTTLRLYLK